MTEPPFQFIGPYMNLAKGGTALKLHERNIVLPDRKTAPRIIMVTDQLRAPRVFEAARALPPGSAVLFRDYETPARLELGRQLRILCRQQRLPFLVAGNGRLAAHLRADGLHMPEACAQGARCWRMWRPNWFITMAAHSPMALQRAAQVGADAALLSPVFPTHSHPSAKPLGVLGFASLAHRSPLPVYAFGGVNRRTVRRLAGTRLCGIAAVSGLSTN